MNTCEFGYYILGNDKVQDHCVALVKSIRRYNKAVPICIIPYDNDYGKLMKALHSYRVFDFNEWDRTALARIIEVVDYVFDKPEAPKHANKRGRLRHFASWGGCFEKFVYLDADIVVMSDLKETFNAQLDENDFVMHDQQWKNGLKWVFTEQIRELLTEEQLKITFNNGCWGARKDALNFEQLLELLKRCKDMYKYFDFASGVLVQPIINYIVLTQIEKRVNLLADPKANECWAGLKYRYEDGQLYDQSDTKLPFMHWAGKPIEPGGHYWDLWKYYFESSQEESWGFNFVDLKS